ncbi:MAG: hypothetical protein HYR72_16745 [Deltaproteobacteria bacterium]|nr:hypothetical protein [Deltaproteobacteria bacterium]MBI3389886.1 hypothetical protein [Deltaproteobacteria bacterium]
MIWRRTVLVLGAGASAEFGFPSGFELLRQLTYPSPDTRSNPVLTRLADCGYDPSTITQFSMALAHSGKTSVDAFLEHRPDFLEVGKAAIACALIPCESDDRLFDRSKAAPSWYDYLYDKLNAPPQKFEGNQLSVITFNYYRSLEHYLTTALVNSYRISRDEAADLVRRFTPILHVHGELAPYARLDSPGRPYDPSANGATVRLAAESIRIIHETEAGDAFRVAIERLGAAERILFLGFGYHPTNLARLRVRDLPRVPVWGTSRGLRKAEWTSVKEMFENHIELDPGGCEILPYLPDTVMLDK